MKTTTPSTTFTERPTVIFKWLLFLVIFGAQNSFAQNTFDGSSSNLWNVAANWSLNHVPTSLENAVIPNAFAVLLDTNATVATLTVGGGSSGSLQIGNSNTDRVLTVTGAVTINSGATLNATGNPSPNTLNIGGNLTNNGTFTDSAGLVDIIFNGAAQTLSGSGSFTFTNFLFSTVGTKTINANITVTGSWTSNGATVGGTGTVSLSGGSQTIGGTSATISFPSLSLSGGTKTSSSKPLAISGNLSIASGALVNLGTLATHTANTLTLGGLGTTNAKFGSNSTTATAPVFKNNTYFTAGTTGYITVATSTCIAPTITFSSIANICAGASSYSIPYTAVTGSPNVYSISGTGITSVTNGTLNAPSSSITVGLNPVAVAGTISPSAFTVSSSVTGCASANLSGSVTVNARPTGAISGGATYCNGQNTTTSLSIAVTGAGPWNGTLSNGTPFSGSSSPISVSVTPSGTTTYTIATLTDANCTANAGDKTGSATVTVNARPTGVISGGAAYCIGQSTTTSLSIAVTGAGSWSGTLSDGTPFSGSSSPISVSVTPSGTTTYTIATLTDANCTANSGDKTGSATVTVNPLPIVTATNVSGCPNTNIALIGSPVGGIFSITNPYNGSVSTTYTYTYTDGNGCANTSNTATVTVYTEINFNSIDDNCDGSLFDGHAPVEVIITSPDNGTLATMDATINATTATNTSPYSGDPQVTYKFKVAKTNAPTSVVYVTSSTPSFTFSSASNAAHSSTYNVQPTAIVNGEEQPYNENAMSNYTTPAVPTLPNPPTQTGPAVGPCAYTLAALNSYIYANNSTTYGANQYEFLVERMNGATVVQTVSVATTVPYFKLTNIVGIPATMEVIYGTTYRIKVRYGYGATSFGSQIYTAYGTECLVSTPALPLASIPCGITLASINSYIYANGNAGGANQFEFKVTRVSPQQPGELPITVTEEILPGRTVANFRLNMLNSLLVSYQKEYSISVRYRINASGTQQFSEWSTPCPLFTPEFPSTQVVENQCGVEGVPSSINEYIYAEAVAGATVYRFRLFNNTDAPYTEESPYDYSVYSPGKYVKLIEFPGLIAGMTYTVTVVAQQYGEYPDIAAAKDCAVDAPASTPEGPAKFVATAVFQATAYPNPFASNFMIDVKTSSESVVSLKVYDMIGRLIDQSDVSVSDLESTTIGENYPTGIYNVVVSQQDNVQTVRVVKR